MIESVVFSQSINRFIIKSLNSNNNNNDKFESKGVCLIDSNSYIHLLNI
jgi:hypothetical protein